MGSRKASSLKRSPRTGLTFKQQIFVDAYLGQANGNASEAARIAGYRVPGQQGHENLAKPAIRKLIDERLAESAMSAAEVLSRLSEMAAGTIADFVELKDGGYKLDLDRARSSGKIRLVRKLTPNLYGTAIELHDSRKALEQLGKYHGLWRRRTEFDVDAQVDATPLDPEAAKRALMAADDAGDD